MIASNLISKQSAASAVEKYPRPSGEDDGLYNILLYQAAQKLIDNKKAGYSVFVEALAEPHKALFIISEQLEALGVSQSLSEHLIRALKDYVLSKGGNFARAVNAKPVYIAAEVSDNMPDFRFSEGITEMTAIDETSIKTEGVANVELHTTITGTKTTSNRADIDEMFKDTKSHKLWIRFEAPTKDELDGLMTDQQMTLVALGETIGGVIAASELKELLDKIEHEVFLTTEALEVLEHLIEIRSIIEAGGSPENEPRLKELSDEITAQIAIGLDNNTIPLPLAQGAIKALILLSETHGMAVIMPAVLLQSLETKAALIQITQNLESIIDAYDFEQDQIVVSEIKALLESIDDIEHIDPLTTLETISEKLFDLEMPDALTEKITTIIANIETLKATNIDITVKLQSDQKRDAFVSKNETSLIEVTQKPITNVKNETSVSKSVPASLETETTNADVSMPVKVVSSQEESSENTVINAAKIFRMATQSKETSKEANIKARDNLHKIPAESTSIIKKSADVINLHNHKNEVQTLNKNHRGPIAEEFSSAAPHNGDKQVTIQLEKDIISPEEGIRNHPPGCTCPSCAGADLGKGQELDLSAANSAQLDMTLPTDNYQPMSSDAVDAKIPEVIHPPGCTCPSCAGADLGRGTEIDLSANNKNQLDINAPTENYKQMESYSPKAKIPEAIHPPGCTCPSCARADLGHGHESDLSIADSDHLDIAVPKSGNALKLQPAA